MLNNTDVTLNVTFQPTSYSSSSSCQCVAASPNLLSPLYRIYVDTVDGVPMNSVHISVRIQLQTEDPLGHGERGMRIN